MIYPLIAVILALIALILTGMVIRMRREWRRAVILQQVGLQLNATIRRKELLQRIMETTAATMSAEGSSIILVDEEKGDLYFEVAVGDKNDEVKEIRLKRGEGIAGWVAEHGKPVLIADAAKDPRWSNRVAEKVNIPTRDLLCVPVVSNGRTLGVLQVINKKGRGGRARFTHKDLRLLEMIASPTAIALENMLLMEHIRETTAAKERMESELKIAQEIQRSLLPGEELRAERVELYACLVPARIVGGDFYHFIRLDETKLLFCLGDVSDKGIPAALFMSSLMIRIQSKAEAGRLPSQILADVNREVSDDQSTMFATIFLAVLDMETGVLTYCNGGHCPPYRWSPARGARPLERHGHLPLGIDADERYEDRQTVLEEGERLVLYSDGITEAENARGEWFREERLRKALEEAGGSDPRPLAEEIRRRVHDFAGEQPQSDDIAILVLKFGELHHKSPENA